MKIKLELFGASRDFSEKDHLELEIQDKASVDDLRNPDHMCDCRKPMDEREHIDILTYDKITEGLL